MGHEYNRNKPPYQVFPCVFGQPGYLVQPDREIANMGTYVALVAFQVEACSRLPTYGVGRPPDQTIQRFGQARDGLQVSGYALQSGRATLCQHLTHTLSQFPLPLPAFRHLLPEVVGVEHEAIEQEPRGHVRAAVRTAVPANAQFWLPAARSAALEQKRRVEREAASLAPAPTLRYHPEPAAALGARIPHQHDRVVQPPGSFGESLGHTDELERPADDIHPCAGRGTISEGTGAGSAVASTSDPGTTTFSPAFRASAPDASGPSIAFWFFGVNLLPHALQKRIRRSPIVLVLRTPLLTDLPICPQ